MNAGGKKMVHEGKHDSNGLFELIQWRVAENPGNTGGDAFLQLKGKQRGLDPSALRGRANLFDVLQQKPVEADAAKVVGDLWTDTKGKKRVMDPGERRGRTNLFEVRANQG